MGEGRFAEACFTVELGRREITFLNCDGVEGIENGRSAEIEIKVTPHAWEGIDYLSPLILGEGATSLAYFNKDGSAYVLLFLNLHVFCGDLLILFVVISICETFV